jgi:uncharacterized protein
VVSVPPTHVTFRSQGRDLDGHVFPAGPSDTPGPGLLFVHGLGSDQVGYLPRAERASRLLGTTCLTFDLGGHGQSTGDRGELSLRDHLADATAAYDLLASQARLAPARIGVCAASYGGYLAAALMARRPVARLLLRAPALYADDDLGATPATRRSGIEPGAAKGFLSRLGSFEGEVLIVESERDEVIAHATVDAYARAFRRAQAVVIPRAGHALVDPGSAETFARYIVDWFREL